MATPESNEAKIAAINTWINSVIQNSKLPAELAAQTSITDVNEVSILQKGVDDAQGVATALLRGFQGTWNAATNTPTLADGTGIDLDKFIVTVAGTSDLGSGDISFKVNDRVEFINGVWYQRNGGGIELSLNTGVLTGGEVTVNGGDSAKFDVAAGTGYILDWTIPSAPVATEITWSQFLAQSIPDIAGELFSTVSVVESITPSVGELLIRSGVVTTPQRRRQEIILQGFTHLDGATITGIGIGQKPAYEVVESVLDYVTKLGSINEGNQVEENGANLNINKTTGATTLPFINKLNDPQNPTELTNIAQIAAVHSTFYQDGGGLFVQTSGITDIDPEQWDDGSGTLATVANNKFTVKRFYFFGQAETIAVSFGQAEYASLADAKNNIFLENPVVSPIFALGIFVTALVVKKGVTDLAAAVSGGDAEFVSISSFTSSGGGGSIGNFVTQDTDQLTGNTGNKKWDGAHEFAQIITAPIAPTLPEHLTNKLYVDASDKNLSFGESYIQNYRNRVLDLGATYFPNDGGYDYAKIREQGLEWDMSIMLTPSAVKDGTLYNVKGEDFTVVRATTATYTDENGIIQTALANTARIDFTDREGVLLLEPQSENLVLKSEPTSSEVSDTNISYDSFSWDIGFSNSVRYLDNTLVRSRSVASGITNGNTYTLSFYAITDDLSEPTFGGGNTINSQIGGTSVLNMTATNVIGNIWRCEGSAVAGAGDTAIQKLLTDNSIGFRVVGWQLEELSYATSYIPTTTIAVTRNADEVTGSGSVDSINSEEGVLFVEMAALVNDLTNRQISIGGTSTDRIVLRYTTSSNRITVLLTNSGSQTNLTFDVADITDFHKIAFKYKQDDFSLWIDGVEVATDNSGNVEPSNTYDNINFTEANFSSSPMFARVMKLKVFKTALTDSQLQILTS